SSSSRSCTLTRCSSGARHRQCDDEAGSAGAGRIELYSSAVRGGGPAGDREPEPGAGHRAVAFRRARARLIHTEKALEDPLDRPGGDPRTGVLDADAIALTGAVAVERQPHLS